MLRQLRHFCFTRIHPSWSFYSCVVGIIFGIVLAIFPSISLVRNSYWLILSFVLMIFTLLVPCRFSLVLAFLAGATIGNFRPLPDLESQQLFQNLVGETVILSGEITEDPSHKDGRTTLRLQNLRLQLPRDQPSENSENSEQAVAGIAYVQLAQMYSELERSDEVTIFGKVGAGFGTFVTSFYRPELREIKRAETGDVFARLKNWFAKIVRKFVPSPEVELGLGYLVGQKSGLPEQLATNLQAVGMTHVVVASGAHLGILVTAAKKLFGKLSKFTGLLFSLLLIAGFVLVVGFTPSMTRAALVAGLSLLVGYVGRKFSPLRLILFVAALTLLLVPTNLQNLGWQLSFASFFGILVLGPYLERTFYGGKKPPWLASMLLTSLSTSLICAPILIYNFGSISLLSFVANLVILPTLPYAMLLMFCTGLVGFIAPLAQILGRIATILLDVHIALVNFLSTKTMLIFELPSADPRIFALYVPIMLFLIFSSARRKHRHRRAHPNSAKSHQKIYSG